MLKINQQNIQPYQISFQSKQDINIYRFQQVDENLYRGAVPKAEQIKQLKDFGIQTIIDFRTGRKDKEKLVKEQQTANQYGITYINLPFSASNEPPQAHVEKFFEIVKKAKANNEKVFIHCTYGQDRTGLFSAMYKVEFGLDNLNNAIKEMLKLGHDAESMPKLIPYLRKRYNNDSFNLNNSPYNILGQSLLQTTDSTNKRITLI